MSLRDVDLIEFAIALSARAPSIFCPQVRSEANVHTSGVTTGAHADVQQVLIEDPIQLIIELYQILHDSTVSGRRSERILRDRMRPNSALALGLLP